MASAEEIIKQIKWTLTADPAASATEDAQQFLKLVVESEKYQNPSVYNIVASQAAQSFGGVLGSDKHTTYILAWNKAVANGPAFKNRPVAVDLEYWTDEARKAEIATAQTIIKRINWSLNPDLTVAATEDAEQYVKLQDEFKASITNNVYNIVLDSAARTFIGSMSNVNYKEYVLGWRREAGYGPELKSRSVVIKAKDFEDDPKADIAAAQAFAKKIKWSLSPDPVAAATGDAQQFLKLAEDAKQYPNYNVSSIIQFAANDTAAQLPRLTEYNETWSKIVGSNETDYMTRVIGEKPKSDWFDGGIIAIGDLVIANMHDPKSYKFDHFTVIVGKYKGLPAWKVDYYFRGKNAFGAMVRNHVYAYIRHGQVIGIENPKD